MQEIPPTQEINYSSTPDPSAPIDEFTPLIVPKEPSEKETFIQIQEGVSFVPYRHCCGCTRSPNIMGAIFNFTLWCGFLFLILAFVLRLPFSQNLVSSDFGKQFLGIFVLPDFKIYLGILGGIYLIYFIDVFCTNTRKYLSNMDYLEDFMTFINRIKSTPPTMGFSCECYHYETRYRTVHYKDSQGNSRTRQESYQEKVVTHRETERFNYREWEDISGNVTQDILVFIATKVKFTKNWVCGDQRTLQIYEEQKGRFIGRNKFRDVHFSFWTFYDINGFQDRKLCIVDLGQSSPHMKFSSYLMFSLLLMCSWPYRMWLEYKTVRSRFHVTKRIYT